MSLTKTIFFCKLLKHQRTQRKTEQITSTIECLMTLKKPFADTLRMPPSVRRHYGISLPRPTIIANSNATFVRL